MKFLSVFLIVFFLFLVGCGAPTNKSKNNDDKVTQNNKTEIIFWHGMGGPLGKTLDELIQKFNATHDNIVVKGVHMGSYDTLQQKIIASLMAKTSPDIAQCYEALTMKLLSAGKLVCLDDYIKKEKNFNLADIYPVFIKNNTYNGKIYSFPFNKSLPLLYYNKDMFKKAGLDPEKPPKTWDEMYDYSVKLTKDLDGDGKIDQWGQAFSTSAWIYECMILQAGGEIYSKDSKKAEFDSLESVKSLEYLIKTLNNVAYKTVGFDHQNDFVAGKVGMIMGSSVSKVFMGKQITFDYGIAPLPKDKKKGVILSGTNVVVLKSNTAKEKAAWEFIKWFTAPEQTAYWSIRTNYLPVRKSAMNTDIMKSALKNDIGFDALSSQLDYADFEPRMPEWYTARQILQQALDKALIEKGDAAIFLKEANKKINEELSQK